MGLWETPTVQKKKNQWTLYSDIANLKCIVLPNFAFRVKFNCTRGCNWSRFTIPWGKVTEWEKRRGGRWEKIRRTERETTPLIYIAIENVDSQSEDQQSPWHETSLKQSFLLTVYFKPWMETIRERRPQMNKIQHINILPVTYLSKPTLPSDAVYRAAGSSRESPSERESNTHGWHSCLFWLVKYTPDKWFLWPQKRVCSKLLQWVSTEVIVKNKGVDSFPLNRQRGGVEKGRETRERPNKLKSEGLVCVKAWQATKFNITVMWDWSPLSCLWWKLTGIVFVVSSGFTRIVSHQRMVWPFSEHWLITGK